MKVFGRKLLENILFVIAALLLSAVLFGVKQLGWGWLSLAGNVALLIYLLKCAVPPRFGENGAPALSKDVEKHGAMPKIIDDIGLLLVGSIAAFGAWAMFRFGGEYMVQAMSVIVYAALIQRACRSKCRGGA